jgi:putative addiction module killer protein
MDTVAQELQEYLTREGRNPFREWLQALRDVRARAKIRVRLNRIRLGSFRNTRSLGKGVFELRIPYGPGYRVYFGRAGRKVVLLLCGGDKRTQREDVVRAKKYWLDYRTRE